MLRLRLVKDISAFWLGIFSINSWSQTLPAHASAQPMRAISSLAEVSIDEYRNEGYLGVHAEASQYFDSNGAPLGFKVTVGHEFYDAATGNSGRRDISCLTNSKDALTTSKTRRAASIKAALDSQSPNCRWSGYIYQNGIDMPWTFSNSTLLVDMKTPLQAGEYINHAAITTYETGTTYSYNCQIYSGERTSGYIQLENLRLEFTGNDFQAEHMTEGHFSHSACNQRN